MPANSNAALQSEPVEVPKHVKGEPWTQAQILDLLKRSDKAVEHALLVLYARQTADEQASGQTVEHNGMGFGAFDAEFLSSLAQQIVANKYGKPDGQRLSLRQMELARKKVLRYSKQLLSVANAGLVLPEKKKRAPKQAPAARVDLGHCPECDDSRVVRDSAGDEVPCTVCGDDPNEV